MASPHKRAFTKHGFKKTRGRPADTSRSGLPKIYPPNIRATVRVRPITR